jgi:hypothetical protein
MLGMVALLINAVTVLFMTGNIWVRQVVYYPLFAFVGLEAFPAYQEENRRRVEWIIQPAHGAMALSSLLLIFVRPSMVPIALALTGVGFQVVAAAATAYEVPRQLRLHRGFDSQVHHELLKGNWVRTFAITAHAGLVVWMLWLVIGGSR